MRAHEIEAWVLRVTQQVESGQPNEDFRVELKAEWPDVQKAARQIAGHANAARGEPILWIIGVDEIRGVVGVDNEELADWSARVSAEFDGLAPELVKNLNVPVRERTIVALLFDTDRAPYLVKNPAYGQPKGGPVQLEVPWREGNSTGTATRSNLLRLLSPMQKNPSFEVLGAWLKVYSELVQDPLTGDLIHSKQRTNLTWKLNMDFYVSPRTDDRVVIPFHRCAAAVRLSECADETGLGGVVLEPLTSLAYRGGTHILRVDSLTIESTKYETLIRGPGRILLRAEVDLPNGSLAHETAEVRIQLEPVDADRPIAFREVLHQTPPDEKNHELACWALDPGVREGHTS